MKSIIFFSFITRKTADWKIVQKLMNELSFINDQCFQGNLSLENKKKSLGIPWKNFIRIQFSIISWNLFIIDFWLI